MQEDLYQDLVENGLGLMCVHDLEGVLLYLNPATAHSLGYQPGDGIGRNLRDFLAEAMRPRFDAYLERIRKQHSDSGFMRLVAKGGEEQTWLYSNRLLETPGREPRVLGHAQNVTNLVHAVFERSEDLQRTNARLKAEMAQRKQVEEELLQARKMESLGVLAGGIAHDFNNILTIVAGNIALARMHARPEDAVSEILNQAERACIRASGLSMQLLTFAKGGSPVRKTSSLGEIIKESAGFAVHESKSRLELTIAPDLWPADVDVGQISQVIQNVILNADQAMAQVGWIELKAENVEVAEGELTVKPGRYTKIQIRDHGEGISAEHLPRIFDPYYSMRAGGSGLGLATSYAVVTKHEGSITAESVPGEGTTIRIYLPASTAPLPPPAEVAHAPEEGAGRILVMDDEELIRNLSRHVLTRLGYDVECAADGTAAVALFESAMGEGRPFRVVVLDLTVPGGMGGADALRKIRELDPQVRAVVSSGYSEDPVMARFEEYGFQGMVAKPWSIQDLSQTLKRVLEEK